MASILKPSQVVDVHYRHLDRENGLFPQEVTLAEALRTALKAKVNGNLIANNVKARVQDNIHNKPNDIRCWNNITAKKGFVFGTLCQYRPSALQPMIKSRLEKQELAAYPLEQIDADKERDFLRAIAYWMAIDDHFYLIQSTSIQTMAMESYFTWLLSKVKVIDEKQSVLFRTEFDRDVVGSDLEDLQSISVGGTFTPAPESESDDTHSGGITIQPGNITEKRKIGRVHFPYLEGILQLLIKGKREDMNEIMDYFRKLRLEDPKAQLNADIDFFITSRKRTRTAKDTKQKTMQAISSALRDLPDGVLTSVGKSGVIKGQDIRLKAPRRINLAPLPEGVPKGAQSALLDLEHTLQELTIVHSRFLEDGKIR